MVVAVAYDSRAMLEGDSNDRGGPLARFLGADHERLHTLLGASLAGPDGVRQEPFEQFRAGILRHISMEEKLLIPRATAALRGQRPTIADLLHVDHGAIAALLVPPPTRAIAAELSSILARHDRCEEEPGGLYAICDRALGAEASANLVAELSKHPQVLVRPFNTSARVALHLKASVDRSWDAWTRWQGGG